MISLNKQSVTLQTEIIFSIIVCDSRQNTQPMSKGKPKKTFTLRTMFGFHLVFQSIFFLLLFYRFHMNIEHDA